MSRIKQIGILLMVIIIGSTSNIYNQFKVYQYKEDSIIPKTSTGFNNWTIMVYLAADNNLESAGLDDLNEMESIQLEEGIEIVVLFDRAVGYTSADGDWTTTRRYNITYDEDNDYINSDYEDLGELNMGDPDTLENFINWSQSNHPADKYALILWDHGLGVGSGSYFGGACIDRYSENDYLDIFEIDQAIAGKGIDLLGFDCCIMGMMEIASQYQTDVDVFVGSECSEPLDGWAYDLIIIELNKNPNCTSAELGEIICATYEESYRYDYTWEDLPMVSLDLTKFAELETILNDFLSYIDQDYNKSIANIIQKAIEDSQFVEYDENYIDFGDLFSHLKSLFRYIYPNLYQFTSNILEIYEEIVMSLYIARHRKKTLTGASIQILPDEENFRYQNLDFCINTSWHNFISKQKTIADELIDDNYEPNDNFDDRQKLSFSESLNLIWSDQDWFEIYVIQNVSFSLILNETSFQPNEVDIIIYDRSLNLVDKAPFNLSLELEQSGYYTICINSSLKFVEVPYTLTLTTNIIDDNYENNNDFADATLITSGSYLDLVSLDDDYYQIHVPESNVLNISIYIPDEDISLYIFLYDSSQNLLDDWRTWYDGFFRMRYFMNNEEDLYIRIRPYYGFGFYSFNISVDFVQDDIFENNDNIENASPIEMGYYSDLTIYDIDYYSITVNEGENLEIDLYYSFYTMDLYILDNESNKFESERITSCFNSKYVYRNTLSFYSYITQNITIVIYSSGYGSFGKYSLKISTTYQKDDIYEENDFLDAATFIQPDFYSNLKQIDDDFYKFNIHQGEYFEIMISSDDTRYFKLKIYDLNMDEIIDYSYYTEGDRCYYYSNIDQPIIIEIRPYNEHIVVYYTLNITLVQVEDDDYEQNDVFEYASPITIGIHPDLIYNDHDYYNISVLEGESIEISLESNLYLYLFLFNSNDQYITSGQGRDIVLKYFSHSNQSLIIYIRKSNGGEYGNYSLEISKEFIIDDDYFEDNDSPETGRELTSGYYSNLIALDDDYYNFSINEDEYLEISLYFRYDGITSINLFLYNSNMELLKSGYHSYNNKSLTYYSEIEQNLIIYVESGLSVGNYCLRINILEDDIYENNDFLDNPTNLTPGNYTNLVQLDDDYYNISVQEGMKYIIYVTPNDIYVSKSYTMTIYDSHLTYITSGKTMGRSRFYAFTSDCNDSIIVRIFNHNLDYRVGSYSLNMSLSLALDDIYEINEFNEENDFPETPTQINPGDYQNLISLDNDYYNLSVEADSVLRVKVKFENSYCSERYLKLADTNLKTLNTSRYKDGIYYFSYLFKEAQDVLIVLTIYHGFTDYSMNVSIHPSEDDIYEQNDTPENAAVLIPGYYSNLKYYDNDYYNLTLHEYEILDIKIDSQYSRYFSFTLYDSNMEILDKIDFHYYYYYINRFSLRYFSEINQSVTLHVYCTFDSGSYTLNISTTFIGLDDIFEENDNPGNAAIINSHKYNLISLDDDYYNLSVQKGDFIEINLNFNINNLNFDLFIFNSSMTLLYSSDSRYEFENIQFYSEKNENLIILIHSIFGCDFYTLDISIVHFEEDIYEENDTPESAATISEGVHLDLMCGDNDFYRFTSPAGYNLSIWLSSSQANVDLDLKIFDSDMFLLDSSISCTSDEYIQFLLWKDMEIFILVDSFSGFGSYNLTINLVLIADDSYEDNDSPETATLISENNYIGLLCLDMDYYTLYLEEAEQFEIDIEYDLSYFDLYCVIYDSEMNILNSSEFLPYSYHLSITLTHNQSIFIEIGSKNGIGQYNFTITLKTSIPDQPIIPKDEFNILILLTSLGFTSLSILIMVIAIKIYIRRRGSNLVN